MKGAPDQLVLNAIAAETALSERINTLVKYRAKITALLNETELTEVQRDNLKHVLAAAMAYAERGEQYEPGNDQTPPEGEAAGC